MDLHESSMSIGKLYGPEIKNKLLNLLEFLYSWFGMLTTAADGQERGEEVGRIHFGPWPLQRSR